MNGLTARVTESIWLIDEFLLQISCATKCHLNFEVPYRIFLIYVNKILEQQYVKRDGLIMSRRKMEACKNGSYVYVT